MTSVTHHTPGPNRNPTESIPLDFGAYLQHKRTQTASFTVDGRPDYAFSGDHRLRSHLQAIGPLRLIAESVTAASASARRQQALMGMAKVSPTQFPGLFTVLRDCAERLALPVPSLFVESSPVVNAYTIATDDRAPFVVVSSTCIDMMTEDQLRFVIGHECGHVQNLHGIYNLMAVLASNIALTQAASLFSVFGGALLLAQQAMRLGLAAWSRAAEITCDRAGAICVRQTDSAVSALAILAAPLRSEAFGQVDPNELVRQAMSTDRTPLRLQEASHSHPLIGKRIFAVKKFLDSDIFASRRPDISRTLPVVPLRAIDAAIERLLSTAHTY